MPRPLLLLVFFLTAWAVLAFGIHSQTQNNTLGTDYYLFYHGGHSVAAGLNPYSQQDALENQLAIYKRIARPDEDQLGFAYPLYTLLPIVPLFFLSFGWSQSIWMAFLIIGLVTAPLLAFRRVPPWAIATILFLYPFSFGILLGNFAVIIAALFIWLYGRNVNQAIIPPREQLLHGVLLAWLTCKPQLTWLFLIFFFLLAFRKKQWHTFTGFAAGLLVMLAASLAVRPSWPVEWLDRLVIYQDYNQTWLTILIFLKDLLPENIALVLTYVLAGGLALLTGWFFYQWLRGRLDNLKMLAWCGLAAYLLHPHGKSYEQISFLLPLAVWAFQQRSLRSGPVWLFWFGSLMFSWAAFALSYLPGMPASTIEWNSLIFFLWIAYLFTRKQPNDQLPSPPGI